MYVVKATIPPRSFLSILPFPVIMQHDAVLLTCTGLGVLGTLAYAEHFPSWMKPTLSMV